MSPEKTKILYEKYPDLFRNRTLPPEESNMCFGFECNDGWFNLIDALCLTITSYQKYNKVEPVIVEQVKEKFGSLRFYYSGGNDFIHGMVRLAEVISEKTCEVCGSAGIIQYDSNWLKCLCEEHKNV